MKKSDNETHVTKKSVLASELTLLNMDLEDAKSIEEKITVLKKIKIKQIELIDAEIEELENKK